MPSVFPSFPHHLMPHPSTHLLPRPSSALQVPDLPCPPAHLSSPSSSVLWICNQHFRSPLVALLVSCFVIYLLSCLPVSCQPACLDPPIRCIINKSLKLSCCFLCLRLGPSPAATLPKQLMQQLMNHGYHQVMKSAVTNVNKSLIKGFQAIKPSVQLKLLMNGFQSK